MTLAKSSAAIVTLGFVAVTATGAYGHCSNDAGLGDISEGEACAQDQDIDTTNGGCNSSPPVFIEIALDGGLPVTYPLGEKSMGGDNDCLPDLDLDATVGARDFIELLLQWGCTAFQGPCTADINMDGIVDTLDLILLILCWGDCPCPPLGNNEIFDQIVVVDATDPVANGLGLVVTHVYATGVEVKPGDRLAGGGNANITISGGTLFQFGESHAPPDSTFCGILPEICLDTFVTNKHLADTTEIEVMPDVVMTANTISGTWFSSPDSNANLVDGLDIVPGTGLFGILIAQITIVPNLGPSSVGYIGEMDLFTGLSAGGGGEGQQSSMAFFLTGACCLTDGNCLENQTLVDCQALGGAYQGDNSLCTPNPCATGACCLADTSCIEDISMGDCEAQGGEYQGDGSTCPLNPFDITGDGIVGINDFLGILAAWGPNPGHDADYDEDGFVGISDLLMLLGNWGQCPP